MSPRTAIIEVFSGVILLLFTHVGVGILGAAIITLISFLYEPLGQPLIFLSIYAFLGVGIFQLFYVVPMVIVLARRQQWDLMKGVILGATLTALLNGGCWLMLTNF